MKIRIGAFLTLLMLPRLLAGGMVKDYKKQFWYLDEFKVRGKETLVVKARQTLSYKIKLKDKQYCFMLEGEHEFSAQVIEKSGNALEIKRSKNKRLILFQNIWEDGIYTIKLWSAYDNEIQMIWGEY